MNPPTKEEKKERTVNLDLESDVNIRFLEKEGRGKKEKSADLSINRLNRAGRKRAGCVTTHSHNRKGKKKPTQRIDPVV